MNESCHIWMCRVTYEWVVTHMNELCRVWMRPGSHMKKSCLMRMSHVSYEGVMSLANESCLMWRSHVSCEWVMSSHVSCERVVLHMNQSSLTYSQISCNNTSFGNKIMSESCHTYEWVTWIRRIFCGVTRHRTGLNGKTSQVTHVTHMTWCDTTQTCARRDMIHSYIRKARQDLFIHMNDETWLIRCHTCDMTFWYARHDLFRYETWLIQTYEWRDMTHPWAPDEKTRRPWELLHGLCRTLFFSCQLYIWGETCMHLNESGHTYEWVISHIRMSHVSRENGSCNIWMSHVARMDASCLTRGWVTLHMWLGRVSRMNEFSTAWRFTHAHMYTPCLTYEWLIFHIWTSHVSRMNESCLTYGWMSHVSHMNESCLTYEWVISHIWMGCQLCEGSFMPIWWSCDAYEWVMSHIWMRRVLHGWVLSRIWMSHVSRTNEWSTQLRKNSFMPIWWSRATYEWVLSHVWMQCLLYL